MATPIELPHVGESVTEGIIGKWLKSPGDHVEKYDPLVEVMTDKVNMEVPSPYSGTLTRTLAAEGATVAMGSAIAEMDVDGEAPSEPEQNRGPSNSGQTIAGIEKSQPGKFEFIESARSVGPTGSGGHDDQEDEKQPTEQPSSFAPAITETTEPFGGRQTLSPVVARVGTRTALSPLVRRLVAQHNVDPLQLTGTGIGGRITKEDVLLFVESRSPASPSSVPIGDNSRADTHDDEILLTPLRKTIADHMARSASEIPSAWGMVEVDVTGLVECRGRHRASFEKDTRIPLTYLPFVAYIVAQVLRDHPRLNSSWEGDRIHLNRRINLGLAVATPEGLFVPVIHDADRLSVSGLAVEIHRLAEAARRKALRLEDVQGGTFTLNNTGALGSVASGPIINHPQAAIMTTEAIVKRPIVIPGDAIAVRSMMNLCLAFDHRVCDGAEASGFQVAIKSRLEAITSDTSMG
jgi:2-oxoisovalerate dehydrogenase E2 component (dihydrolipoyl transacylase)